MTNNNLTVSQYVQPVLTSECNLGHLTQGIAFEERACDFQGSLVPFPQLGVPV